jgi:hypothetical protein
LRLHFRLAAKHIQAVRRMAGTVFGGVDARSHCSCPSQVVQLAGRGHPGTVQSNSLPCRAAISFD